MQDDVMSDLEEKGSGTVLKYSTDAKMKDRLGGRTEDDWGDC